MTADEIAESLDAIASSENFVGSCYRLVKRWESLGVGADALETMYASSKRTPISITACRGHLCTSWKAFANARSTRERS
jgi:hypothetical protein